MKSKRQEEIIKIVAEYSIGTHEELMNELKKRGFDVTQATISRDIKDLRIIKTQSEQGAVYVLPPGGIISDTSIFTRSVKSVRSAMHTVVIRTQPGMAGGVGAAVDDEWGDMMLGTIAGDDTVLVIADDPEAAKELCGKIRIFFGCKGE